MTVGAVLLVYAACTGTLGSRVLGRARWTGRAPLLAIVIYLAASWSVIAALEWTIFPVITTRPTT